MSFYASGQKPASESRHQSPSQAQAVKDIHDSALYWGVNGRSYTYEPKLGRAKTIIEEFVKGANSIPPIGDDRRFDGDHWVKGIGWSGSISPSSSAPFPTHPAWTLPKVQHKGPQSLTRVRNRETISKDNTVGDEARMDHLLATLGKKVMGIKHQEQHEVTPLEYVSKRYKIGKGSQVNGSIYFVSQSSDDLPRALDTNNGDSDMNYSDDKWINPSIISGYATYGEDQAPRQFNGIEIRMKKRKNNLREKGQRSKKGERGYQALLRV